LAELKFKKRVENAPDVYSFIFEKPVDFEWIAGQFTQVTFPHSNPDDRGIKRFFSISSAPFEKIVMVTTRIEINNSSSFKKAFYDIKPEKLVECTAPRGKLIITKQNKKIIFVAGGIGITPIRSIILDLGFNNKLQNIDLMYSNRDENLPFKNDLEAKKENNPTFDIHYFINPYRINGEAIDKIYSEFPDCYVFISGPPVMVKSVEELFILKGLPKENIRTDYFPGY
jgi:glycine betaine catabolism B